MEKIWKFSDCDGAEKLKIFSQNPVLAKLLKNRGLDTDEKAEKFLNPSKSDFLPFDVFKESEKVLKRIFSAIDNGEKILVYGDFDTDGVTSCAILFKTLNHIGAKVGYYLPDRQTDGHGLNSKALVKLIAKEHVKLLITVDCGISDVKEVSFAKSFGCDVIITDHHETPEILPEAFGIINPKAENNVDENLSATQIKSLCDLCGAGIAFKLSVALLEHSGKKDFVKELFPLVATGTVGDIVPLTNENRYLVFEGLKFIRSKQNLGLTKLLEVSGIEDFETVSSETVAFSIVPRINACGRLANPKTAFDLLNSSDENMASNLAKELNDFNELRKQLCLEGSARIEKMLVPEEIKYAAVVLDNESHPGIIGIIAAKIVEDYFVPAFIGTTTDDTIKFSCRAPRGINIHTVLSRNADLFDNWGGHESAGGFSFDKNNVSFEKVKQALITTVREISSETDFKPFIGIDFKIEPEFLNEDLVNTVNMLEPYGASNPKPLFAADGNVSGYKFMGAAQNHLKFSLKIQDKIIDCIKWNTSSFDCDADEPVSIAFSPFINVFNGQKYFRTVAEDIKFKNPKIANKVKIIDAGKSEFNLEKLQRYVEQTDKTVAIFAERKIVKDIFEKYPSCKNKICNRTNFPENTQVVILFDTPPEKGLLKNLKHLETIYVIKYQKNIFEPSDFAAKLIGAVKYCVSHKNGECSIIDLAKAFCVSEDLVREGLLLLKYAKVLDFERSENEISELKFLKPVSASEMNNSKNSDLFKTLINDYNENIENFFNFSVEDLRKYLI